MVLPAVRLAKTYQVAAPPRARPVGGAADQLICQGGKIHLHDGQRGGIPARVFQLMLQRGGIAHRALVLPGHIQQEGIDPARNRDGHRHCGAILHQRHPPRREHAALGGDLLAEILGADHRVAAPQTGNLLGNEFAVFRHLFGHILPAQAEDASDAIPLFGSLRGAQLAPQQRLPRPGRAPEDARGVGGGRHGRHLLIELTGLHVLGFIHLQKGGGGGAHDVALGRGGKEIDARRAHPVDVAGFLLPERAGKRVALEGTLQAAHGVLRLRLPGGRDLDDLRIPVGKQAEQVGFQLRLQLVLAALAREHHHQRQPAALQHRIHHRLRHLLLVGAQGHPQAETGKIQHIAQDQAGIRCQRFFGRDERFAQRASFHRILPARQPDGLKGAVAFEFGSCWSRAPRAWLFPPSVLPSGCEHPAAGLIAGIISTPARSGSAPPPGGWPRPHPGPA